MVEIKSIAPIRCGIVLAVLYALLGLIEALFLIPIMSLTPSEGQNALPPGMRAMFGVGGLILIPLFAAIAGFIGGIISALVYNLVARWTGGLEVRIEQVAGGMEQRPLSS